MCIILHYGKSPDHYFYMNLGQPQQTKSDRCKYEDISMEVIAEFITNTCEAMLNLHQNLLLLLQHPIFEQWQNGINITDYLLLKDSFPSPCGSESLYSTLSERDLTDDISLFKYFALNNQTIIGVLDGQSLNGKSLKIYKYF